MLPLQLFTNLLCWIWVDNSLHNLHYFHELHILIISRILLLLYHILRAELVKVGVGLRKRWSNLFIMMVQKLVISTKSVEYMPFFLSLASFANSVAWTTYAFLPLDPFIAVSYTQFLPFFSLLTSSSLQTEEKENFAYRHLSIEFPLHGTNHFGDMNIFSCNIWQIWQSGLMVSDLLKNI